MSGIHQQAEQIGQRLDEMMETLTAVKGQKYCAAVSIMMRVVQVSQVAMHLGTHLHRHCETFDPEGLAEIMAAQSSRITDELCELLELKGRERELAEDSFRMGSMTVMTGPPEAGH